MASSAKSKAATPAKAQVGEVDYKAKIDAVVDAFTAKVTEDLCPAPVCALHPAPVTSWALTLFWVC